MGLVTSKRKKVVAIGKFAKHLKSENASSSSYTASQPTPDSGSNRNRLNSFLQQMKEDKKEIVDEITTKNPSNGQALLRPKTAGIKPFRDSAKNIIFHSKDCLFCVFAV